MVVLKKSASTSQVVQIAPRGSGKGELKAPGGSQVENDEDSLPVDGRLGYTASNCLDGPPDAGALVVVQPLLL